MGCIIIGFLYYFFSKKVPVLLCKMASIQKAKTGVNSSEFTPVFILRNNCNYVLGNGAPTVISQR
jgi:hypothetical protein